MLDSLIVVIDVIVVVFGLLLCFCELLLMFAFCVSVCCWIGWYCFDCLIYGVFFGLFDFCFVGILVVGLRCLLYTWLFVCLDCGFVLDFGCCVWIVLV